MEKGSSEPWQNVLYDLTDGRVDKLDASAMLEYFQPLYDWLVEQNVTQSEWKCDKYIDRKHNTVKSYNSYTKVNRNNLKVIEETAAVTESSAAAAVLYMPAAYSIVLSLFIIKIRVDLFM